MIVAPHFGPYVLIVAVINASTTGRNELKYVSHPALLQNGNLLFFSIFSHENLEDLRNSRINLQFQGYFFFKFQDNSRKDGSFMKFQEFSRTKVKFKDFFQVCANPEK